MFVGTAFKMYFQSQKVNYYYNNIIYENYKKKQFCDYILPWVPLPRETMRCSWYSGHAAVGRPAAAAVAAGGRASSGAPD